MQSIFRYQAEVVTRFPNLHAGIILAEGLHNQPTPSSLRESLIHAKEIVLDSIGQTQLSDIVSLAAWRAAFRKFGVDPTQYRSAAEALLRRLTKKGDIPSINALTDMANMVSIRYALPVAAFDLHYLSLPITVRFADGSERYTPLGETNMEHPEPGEVIFADETGLVIARRWCYRQSEESAVREDTTRGLFTIEAQHAGGEVDVRRATEELSDLVKQYLGGRCQIDFLP